MMLITKIYLTGLVLTLLLWWLLRLDSVKEYKRTFSDTSVLVYALWIFLYITIITPVYLIGLIWTTL